MNLIFNNNAHLIILEDMLSLLKQQAVVNSLFSEQTLTLCLCFDNLDNDFLKKIRVKKFADYYDKFFHEHNK